MAENEDHCVESEDNFITISQVSSKSSQSWVVNHPSIVDKKTASIYKLLDCFSNAKWCSRQSNHRSSSFIEMWSGRNCKSGKYFFVAY